MEKILAFLGIKTRRSAWLFLIASVGFSGVGVWQYLDLWQKVSLGENVLLVAVWLVLSAFYIGLSLWALFTDKGRDALAKGRTNDAR